MKKIFKISFNLINEGEIKDDLFNIEEIDNQVIGYLIKRKIKEFSCIKLKEFKIIERKK